MARTKYTETKLAKESSSKQLLSVKDGRVKKPSAKGNSKETSSKASTSAKRLKISEESSNLEKENPSVTAGKRPKKGKSKSNISENETARNPETVLSQNQKRFVKRFLEHWFYKFCEDYNVSATVLIGVEGTSDFIVAGCGFTLDTVKRRRQIHNTTFIPPVTAGKYSPGFEVMKNVDMSETIEPEIKRQTKKTKQTEYVEMGIEPQVTRPAKNPPKQTEEYVEIIEEIDETSDGEGSAESVVSQGKAGSREKETQSRDETSDGVGSAEIVVSQGKKAGSREKLTQSRVHNEAQSGGSGLNSGSRVEAGGSGPKSGFRVPNKAKAGISGSKSVSTVPCEDQARVSGSKYESRVHNTAQDGGSGRKTGSTVHNVAQAGGSGQQSGSRVHVETIGLKTNKSKLARKKDGKKTKADFEKNSIPASTILRKNIFDKDVTKVSPFSFF